MSPAALNLWQRVMRRALADTPGLLADIIAAFDVIRASLSDQDIADAMKSGAMDELVSRIIANAVLNTAFQPVKNRLRESIVRAVPTYARNLPVPPAAARDIGIAFDYLSPNVVPAIRGLETTVLTNLESGIRETVRAFVENGLRDGASQATVARNLRPMIGLGRSQLQEVENFRDALLGRNGRTITDYTLRDRRFDAAIRKGNLTPADIEKQVARYRDRRIAQNAQTIAHTAALDAQKLANRLAWQQAIDHGSIDGSKSRKTWIGVMDTRERPEHVAMEKQTVAFHEPFSNGEMIPGASTYNCRCIARYWQATT